MTRQRSKRKPQAPARFKVGDHVRVRRGILDPEHPDVPLGGWAGTIARVDRRRMYLVQWSRETLASIHPVYKKRCAIEGMEFEEYWLGDSDLVPDPGGPLAIEQPARITPRPLSANNPEDRVRMAFGLTVRRFPAPGGRRLTGDLLRLSRQPSVAADGGEVLGAGRTSSPRFCIP